MINKQNLWFITLFSLILVLGIYYVSMGDDALNALAEVKNESPTIKVEESDVIVALRVAEDEQILKSMQEYQDVLLDNTASLEEKNDAYNALQALNSAKGEVEKLEKLISSTYKYDNFIKINGDNISIVVSSKEHNNEIANKIIRTVQDQYKTKKYITVKFEG